MPLAPRGSVPSVPSVPSVSPGSPGSPGSSGHVALDPRPIGWFAVALSHELPRGSEKRGVLGARPYRLWREGSGLIGFGGSISEVSEQNDFILAWHHPRAVAPGWRVPVLSEDGWRPLRHARLNARSHPQETFENSIDLAHFPKVHGFTDIDILEPMQLEEETMRVRYRIARKSPIPAMARRVRPDFEVRLHGIGCAHNHIRVPGADLQIRMFAFSTPTEPGQVEIRLGVSVARQNKLPLKPLIMPIVHRLMMSNIVHDFSQDIEIWENKRYVQRPVLAKEDGPIGKFRRWCQQFYEEQI